MGNRIADVPYPVHQVLDAVEHAVDVAVQALELVLNPSYRDSPAQIARHDISRRPADGADATFDLATKQERAANREQQRHCSARDEGVPHEALDFPLVL